MHKSPTDIKEYASQSSKRFQFINLFILWEMRPNYRWRPDPGTGESFNTRLEVLALGLWNNESSNLFRSREPGSLWALHGTPQVTDDASLQDTDRVRKWDCSTSAVQPQAHMPLNKISPQIRQNGSPPNSPVNSYVLFVSFLSPGSLCTSGQQAQVSVSP